MAKRIALLTGVATVPSSGLARCLRKREEKEEKKRYAECRRRITS
jgi:hypothetical protein